MKLLQLNAWGGRLEPQIRDLLQQEQPDILCLQESISFNGSGTGLFITIENIQEKHDLPYVSFAPAFSFNFMKGIARFGNCILSRFPITKTEVIYTHLKHKDNFMWGEDSNNVRNFLYVSVDIDGKACQIITHHGFWVPEHKNGTPETELQVKTIAEYIKKLDGPIIVTGDFNLVANSESMRPLNEMLTNLSVEHALQTTRTDLTLKTETCDYIFINDQIQVSDFQALDKVASDHKALRLEFDL